MAEDKKAKGAKSPEPKVVEAEVVRDDKKSHGSWGSKLIWGALFIAIGLVMLLSNLGVVAVDLFSLWKLWPVLIVIAGLSILSLRGWLAWMVYGLAALGIAALTWSVLTGAVGDNRSSDTSDSVSVSRASDEVKKLDLSVDGGAGSLTFESHDGSELVKGELKGQSTKFKQETKIEDNMQTVKISTRREGGFYIGGGLNDAKIWIHEKTPTSLNIDAGASDIKADLSKVMLESLDIDTGASSVDAKLGSLMSEVRVNIDTGASSVTVRVPKDSGVKLVIDNGLSSEKIPGDFTKKDDKTYQSPGYDNKKNKIIIDLDMGVSSFNLEQY